PFGACELAAPIDIGCALAADAEMSDAAEPVLDRPGLDQDEDEGPRAVAQPDDGPAGLGIGTAMDDLHPRVAAIEVDARVEVRGRQGDVREAEIRHRKPQGPRAPARPSFPVTAARGACKGSRRPT